MFQNTKDSSEEPANKKWPLNPPDFHWQCHHLQQRTPTHEKWNIVHHPLGTPSAGGPWRGQPTGREKGDECKATSALRNMQELWTWTHSKHKTHTSSAVQKEASAFLYICQMSWYWIGKMTKRRGFSFSRGSSSTLVLLGLGFCWKKRKTDFRNSSRRLLV